MSEGHIFCSHCGQPNPAGVKFCGKCGAEIVQLQPPPPVQPLPPSQQPTAYTPQPPPVYTPPQQAYVPPQGGYSGPYQGSPIYAGPPQAKKSGSGLRTCGILLVVLVCLCGVTAVAGYFLGDKLVAAVSQQIPDLGELLEKYLGTQIVNPVLDEMITGQNSLSITSSSGGKVSSTDGASIIIPPGAVPPMDDGTAGTMVFSIEKDPSKTPTLPGDFKPLGSVYNLGPEGFIFSIPITITLPIPEDVDPQTVLGLTFFDTTSGIWKLLPGSVDVEARTASVTSTHFSYWGLFGRCIDTFGGCRYAEAMDQWNREHGGWIKVINSHVYNTGSYPGGRNLGTSSGYGVCIQTFSFDNADEDARNWLEPLNWTIMAYDNSTSNFWMPRGQYNLIEFFSLSEVNHDPLYVPDYASYWRSIGSYAITAGNTIEFTVDNIDLNDGSFTEGRPPCWGVEDTSVGTGDVQVTLTWQTNDDIDLYVTDPNGDTVYFYNDVVASGGELDRDNTCSDFVLGRPENIFWPQDGAPQGSYVVKVNYFGPCGDVHPVNWTVRVVNEGNVQTFNGTLQYDDETQDVTTFTVQ